MKQIIALAALVAATCSAFVAHADEIRKCDFAVKARCVTGDASVTLANGNVTKLSVNVDWCGRGGSPGYSCVIDATRGEHDSTWSDDSGATLITNASPSNPAQPDRVKVTVGKHVSIDFDEAQSLGRCGAGAELPHAIVIPDKGGACRVWLTEP
jgi:hypothetical protein